MPRLFFQVRPRLRVVLVVLMLLPCLPGLTFLLAGLACDPIWPLQTPRPDLPARYERAAQQARGLYRAGGVALGVGTLCGVGVAWTVLRHRTDEEEDEAADS